MSKAQYEIVEVEGRGKMMIATADMKPGTKLFDEAAPLMTFPGNLIQTDILAYTAFQDLTADQQRRVLNLYGPTTGVEPEFTRSMAKKVSLLHKGEPVARKLTNAEVELYVKLGSVARLNMFSADDVHVIYETVTRMSHSCLPNCTWQIYGRSMACRTILPVAAGQELTIEYNGLHRWKPTHIRRQNYCIKKQFTCHCPRCDAEGDDTRLFDCFDPTCSGSHLVCHPLSKEPLPMPGLSYTGVEYVEPHLLPCTVCHRAPPLKYQEDMFKLEKKLQVTNDELAQVFDSFKDCKDLEALMSVPTAPALNRIQALKMPRGHSLTVSLLKTRYNIAGLAACATVPAPARVKGPPFVETCVRELIGAVQRRTKFPNGQEAEELIDTCFSIRFCDTYSRAFALECCQKGLAMYLILHGRDCERNKYNDMMVQLLGQLPPQPATTTECMFCRESPLRAAITLSRCSRCKQMTYCSAGCQKAHWPVHKKNCLKKV